VKAHYKTLAEALLSMETISIVSVNVFFLIQSFIFFA